MKISTSNKRSTSKNKQGLYRVSIISILSISFGKKKPKQRKKYK